MGDFFNKPFKEQIERIVATEDLKLLQAFIGIRNPIALLQYNFSFIATKINLMETRLHGEFKVQERFLQWYRQNVIGSEKAYSKTTEEIFTSIISHASKEMIDELLSNILLPRSNNKIGSRDSICNSHYMKPSSNSDWELVQFVRNTDITLLCCIGGDQVKSLYNAFVAKSKESVQKIVDSHPTGSYEQRDEISVHLHLLRNKIYEMENEIVKYKEYLKKIKDRSFLYDWYKELMKTVQENIRKKDHILNKYFLKYQSKEDVFVENFKIQYPEEITRRILMKFHANDKDFDYLKDIILGELILSERLDYEHVAKQVNDRLKLIYHEFKKEFRNVLDRVIDKIIPSIIMDAEQCVLDDILVEAVVQEKVNSVLLLVCNGANINLLNEERCKSAVKIKKELKEIFNKSGFLVIEELYSDMPLIKGYINKNINVLNSINVSGVFQSDENIAEFNIGGIFGLEEIKETFPEESAIGKIANSIASSEKDKATYERQIEAKYYLLKRLQEEKLLYKVENFIKPWWRFGLTVLFVGLPLIGFLMYDAGKSWNTRRNAQNELEVAHEDLNRVTRLFEILLEYLQSTIVAGSDIYEQKCNLIKKEIEVIRGNKAKWVNLANVLTQFENIEKDRNENLPTFVTKSIKFNMLAEAIINNRMIYMKELFRSSESGASESYACNPPVLLASKQKALDELKQIKEEVEDVKHSRESLDLKNKIYADLLHQLQNGELPISALEDLYIQ